MDKPVIHCLIERIPVGILILHTGVLESCVMKKEEMECGEIIPMIRLVDELVG